MAADTLHDILSPEEPKKPASLAELPLNLALKQQLDLLSHLSEDDPEDKARFLKQSDAEIWDQIDWIRKNASDKGGKGEGTYGERVGNIWLTLWAEDRAQAKLAGMQQQEQAREAVTEAVSQRVPLPGIKTAMEALSPPSLEEQAFVKSLINKGIFAGTTSLPERAAAHMKAIQDGLFAKDGEFSWSAEMQYAYTKAINAQLEADHPLALLGGVFAGIGVAVMLPETAPAELANLNTAAKAVVNPAAFLHGKLPDAVASMAGGALLVSAQRAGDTGGNMDAAKIGVLDGAIRYGIAPYAMLKGVLGIFKAGDAVYKAYQNSPEAIQKLAQAAGLSAVITEMAVSDASPPAPTDTPQTVTKTSQKSPSFNR